MWREVGSSWTMMGKRRFLRLRERLTCSTQLSLVSWAMSSWYWSTSCSFMVPGSWLVCTACTVVCWLGQATRRALLICWTRAGELLVVSTGSDRVARCRVSDGLVLHFLEVSVCYWVMWTWWGWSQICGRSGQESLAVVWQTNCFLEGSLYGELNQVYPLPPRSTKARAR